MTWAESAECAKCGRSFPSRNQLFNQLRESQSCGSGTSPCQKGSTDSSGSTSIGRRSTDDDSPAPRSSEDEDEKQVLGSHVETPLRDGCEGSVPEPIAVASKTIGESVYDVCEVFSPPRVSDAALKRGLRGG